MPRTLFAPAPLAVGELCLDPDESRHAAAALRLTAGDAVRLVDGAGGVGEGVVSATGRRVSVRVERVRREPPGPAWPLAVAVCPPKGDRWDELLRALCELGVGRILPLQAARSVRRLSGTARERRVLREALKQCRRAWLPELAAPAGLAAVASAPARRILLDPGGGRPQPGRPEPTVLIIGPEGGFSDEELAALEAAGAERVRLTDGILRIDTAALAAAAVWAAAWEHATL